MLTVDSLIVNVDSYRAVDVDVCVVNCRQTEDKEDKRKTITSPL
jgi:hypothetical protein